MKNLREIKKKLIILTATSAEKLHPTPLIWKGSGNHASSNFPIITILAIPWTTWPNGWGMKKLRSLLLPADKAPHRVEIPITRPEKKLGGIHQIEAALVNKEPEKEESIPFTWETYPEEIVLITPEKNKILPPRNPNSLPRLVGTWIEFAEYFEGNRRGGWVGMTTEKTNDEEEYVPPMALNFDLSLLEGNKPNFEAAGLPTGNELKSLLHGLSTLRTRMLNILLHGKQEVVSEYEKELVEASKKLTHRLNFRWLNPINLKLEGGILENKSNSEADPEAIQKIFEALPSWEETFRELPENQQKSSQAIIAYQNALWAEEALDLYAKKNNIAKEVSQIDSYEKMPSVESIVEEKKEYEREEKDYTNRGWTLLRPFQKEELLSALRNTVKKQAILQWFEIMKLVKKTQREAKLLWEPKFFSNPINLLDYSTNFLSLWPKYAESWRKTGARIFNENVDQLETKFTRALRTIKPENLIHTAKTLLLGNAPQEVKELHQEWIKASQECLQNNAEKTIQEVKEIILVTKKNIHPKETLLKVLYLYGEINNLEPTPKDVVPLEIKVSTKKGILPKDWEPIEKKLGESQTPILTYPVKESYSKTVTKLGLRIPGKNIGYVEPSTLPNIPEGLRELSSLQTIQKTLENPEGIQDKKQKIQLNIRLKPKTDPITNLHLDLDNLQISVFNPVIGKPTGLKDTFLWRPIFTKQGIEWAKNALQEFGYNLEAEPAVYNYAEKKMRQAERMLSPNYALTQYEMLAYYQNGERVAEKTILNPETGDPLWIAGKAYQITPSWDREQILVDNFTEEEEICQNFQDDSVNPDLTILGDTRTKIQGAERIERLNQVSINFGFSTFLVRGEDGKTHKIKETLNRENSSVEKERIAEELQTVIERIEEIETTYTKSRRKAAWKTSFPSKEMSNTEQKNNEEDNIKKQLVITPAVARELQDLQTKRKKLENDLERWMPSIDDFIEAFPPEAPPLSTQIYEEELKTISKRIMKRFAPFMQSDLPQGTNDKTQAPYCTIKNYQLRGAALMALKRSSGNGGHPGSGKTITSIMASWAMGHHYNLIIAPTIALNTWAKELEKVGLHHEIIGYRKGKNQIWHPSGTAYSDLREIKRRLHNRERKTNRLGKIEPEYYIVSAETLSLGGKGNLRFNPWHYDYPINKKAQKILDETDLPDHWEIIENPIKSYKIKDFENIRTIVVDGENIFLTKHLRVWSDRADNSHELIKANLKRTFKTISFRRAIKSCPTCHSYGENWSEKGHCRICGHNHSAITKVPVKWNEKLSKQPAETLNKKGFKITTQLPKKPWQGEKTSNTQFPGYKLLGKHFGLKIIDEIHNFSSFSSEHGNALLQVKSKDTIILSGTLCKTHITELEPSLCHIYEANSGEFPYTPWGMELFKEQFSTFEINNSTEIRNGRNGRTAKRRKTTSRIPEASNLTKLRSLMHGVIVSVSEKEMAKEWNLRPIHESILYVELDRENATLYQEWQDKIKKAYEACQTEAEKTNMLQKGRKMLTNLAYACDGPEKLQATINWIQEGIRTGQRSVVVGPSTRFYTLLNQELKNQGIDFMSIGNIPPEKRFDALNKFKNSKCPVLTSRIRLINVNFNQLTCCQRILFTGVDPSPAAIRQMQMRLNRIGQTQDVTCTFLITRGLLQPPKQVITRNHSNLTDLEKQIQNATGETTHTTTPENPEQENQRRIPSYEERLFATVLRREKAIQAVLNQTDKQRDPQELYDMIQSRQTLNEVLRDIATEAALDQSLLKEINQFHVHTKNPAEKIIEIPQNTNQIIDNKKHEKYVEKPPATNPTKQAKPQEKAHQLVFDF